MSDYKELITNFSDITDYVHGYEHVVSENERKTSLLSFYLPLVWLFMERGGELPAFSIEREDGTFTTEESIHCPRGEMKRKLLYDISRKVNREGKIEYKLNNYWFNQIGVLSAYRIIQMDVVGNEYALKREDIDERQIEDWSRSLEGLTDEAVYKNSRYNASVLRRAGLNISSNVVFGERLNERIFQTVESIPFKREQMRVFGRKLIEKIKEVKYIIIQERRDDYAFKCEIKESDNVMSMDNVEFLKYGIDISFNVHIGTESSKALAYLGIMDDNQSYLRREIGMTRGTYGAFKYDDPLFRDGYKIWRSQRGYMENFFKATNISTKTQILLLKAYENFERMRYHQYLLSLSPRNLFFIRDDASNLIGKNLVTNTLNIDIYRAILVGETLRGCNDLTGNKFEIVFSDEAKYKLDRIVLT